MARRSSALLGMTNNTYTAPVCGSMDRCALRGYSLRSTRAFVLLVLFLTVSVDCDTFLPDLYPVPIVGTLALSDSLGCHKAASIDVT
eukprot:COSAG01_NODE_2715_length_7199_cov_15.544507_2_plen_87_part_00